MFVKYYKQNATKINKIQKKKIQVHLGAQFDLERVDELLPG